MTDIAGMSYATHVYYTDATSENPDSRDIRLEEHEPGLERSEQ